MSVLGTVLDYIKYFEGRKRRKQQDPLFEKETRGLDMLRRIRDNVKLTRIGSPQGSIKININPENIRRGLRKLKESRDHLGQNKVYKSLR